MLLLSFLFYSCKYDNWQTESEKFHSTGIIIGPDMRMCPSPCCGGWNIIIENQSYTFGSLPANSGIDLGKEKFPLRVKLDWKLDTTIRCNYIIIIRIAIDQQAI